MAPKEKDGTGPAANAPATSVRRSKRLQDQSSRLKEKSSRAESDKIIATKLPPEVSKIGRKIKKASSTASKQSTRPAKKIAKTKILVNDSEPHSDSEKPAKVDGENNAISIEATLDQQHSQLSADNVENKSASQTGRSRHSPNKDTQGQGGDHPPSPKRKLDQSKAQDASNNEPLTKSPRPSSNSHIRSGNTRMFRTLHRLLSAERQIDEHLSKDICCTDTVDVSRLPSPLADLGHQRDRFLHFIENHVPDQVRLLFHDIRNDSPYYKRKITREFARKAQGVFVEFVSGTQPALGGGSDQRDEDDMRDDAVYTATHPWPGNAPKYESRLGTSDEEANVLLQGTNLEAYVFEHPEVGQRGHYLVSNYDRLVINESVFGRDLIAGPLPGFAIIQIDQYTIFWWRNIEALDYIPQRDMLDIIQQGQEIGTKEQQSAPPEEGWADILDRGLARHRTHRGLSGPPKKGKEPYQLDRYWNLYIDSVVLAIASIWDALRKRAVIHAFAGVDVFDPDLVRMDGFSGDGVVGGPRKFIMPLSIPPNSFAQKTAIDYHNKNKGNAKQSKDAAAGPAVGHILLAVAERLPGEGNVIKIDIFDSRIGTFPRQMINSKAAMLATRSGWPGHRRSQYSGMPFERWPRDELPRVNGQLIPQQPDGSNACGLFTILNAWAVMLGIPLRNNRLRRGSRSDRELLGLGQELVNLALAGSMDSRTIQAFLNVFGLSERQEVPSQGNDVVMQVDAVRMNPQKLLDVLSLQKHRDANFPMPSLTPDSEGGTDQGNQFSEDDIRLLMISGGIEATREQALRALRQTNGNLEDAVAIIQAENKTPEPPINE